MSSIFIQSIFLLLLFVSLDILLAHLFFKMFYIKRSALLFLCFQCLIFLQFFKNNSFGAAVFALFLFTSYWCFYMIVLTSARNSVTLRMMDEIEKHNGLTRARIAEIYSDEDSVRSRLRGMQSSGMLIIHGVDNILLTERGMRIGKIALFLRKIFSIQKAG